MLREEGLLDARAVAERARCKTSRSRPASRGSSARASTGWSQGEAARPPCIGDRLHLLGRRGRPSRRRRTTQTPEDPGPVSRSSSGVTSSPT